MSNAFPFMGSSSQVLGVVQNPVPAQNPDGSNVLVEMDRQGALLASEIHGKRYVAAARGDLFWGDTGAVTLPVASTATAAVAVLYNPPSSGKLVEVHKLVFTQILATDVIDGLSMGVGVNIGTSVAAPSAVTNASILSMPLNGAALSNVAKCYNAATIVAPTITVGLGYGILVTTGPAATGIVEKDFDGTLVLAPGSLISIGCSTTIQGGANMIVGFLWSEWLP